MTCKYTLEWLDTAVASSLKHLECGPSVADGGQLASVIDDAPLRAAEVQSSIKQQLFSLTKERHAELLIRQYHTALIALYDMLLEHYPAFKASGGILPDIFTCLSEVISGLLAFITRQIVCHCYLPSYACRKCSSMHFLHLDKGLVTWATVRCFRFLALHTVRGIINFSVRRQPTQISSMRLAASGSP